MAQFNYHKLVNLKKRYAPYDCDISKEIVAVIDKHLILEKQKREAKTIQTRTTYQDEKMTCEKCSKELKRKSYYKHNCEPSLIVPTKKVSL